MPLDKPAVTGALSGLVGGTLASALTSKKSARGLLKTGGLIAIGGLAWKAYDSYRKSADKPASKTRFVESIDDNAMLIIDAMIAAAHADGRLTETEKQVIWKEALDSRLPSSVLDELSMRMEHPLSSAELAEQADCMELKIEVYTAATLIVDETCASGGEYLDDLSALLGLPAALRETLDRSVQQEPVAA